VPIFGDFDFFPCEAHLKRKNIARERQLREELWCKFKLKRFATWKMWKFSRFKAVNKIGK
jgi:hypothetical protein